MLLMLPACGSAIEFAGDVQEASQATRATRQAEGEGEAEARQERLSLRCRTAGGYLKQDGGGAWRCTIQTLTEVMPNQTFVVGQWAYVVEDVKSNDRIRVGGERKKAPPGSVFVIVTVGVVNRGPSSGQPRLFGFQLASPQSWVAPVYPAELPTIEPDEDWLVNLIYEWPAHRRHPWLRTYDDERIVHVVELGRVVK